MLSRLIFQNSTSGRSLQKTKLELGYHIVLLCRLVDLRDQIKYTVNGSLCYRMRVDHIAIAVNNVQQALTDYQKIFSVDELKIEEVPNEKVRVAMLMLEDTRIELMEPMAPDSPISKFLQERGEGIHHIAITADNIEKDVARASENGMKMLGGLRTGSYGRKITFIHPKSLHGVLTEFCEAAPPSQSEVANKEE
jgi:methylmalonyl-CoA/ethylmalonyl-CoA epimerase